MKLSNLILKAIFFTAIASTFLAFVINTLFEYNNFLNEKDQMRKDFTEQKKSEIKREVNKMYNYISYNENNIIIKAKEKLRNRVNDAYAIAYKIYNKNKNIKTEKEIQYLIITTLQNITYESDTYFFINSNQGRAILFNKKSYLDTNKNIWNLKDEKGTYFIQKQSNIALNKKEGFIDNFFVKPNTEKSKPYDKLTFIKLFEPYNWHIGMGFYIDNLTNETKDEVLKYIASIL
jgi:signal transduction histidine kinase